MAQLGDTVITGSLSVTNSIHGTADNAINANITKTADSTNGDKLQIGNGTAVNITNAVNATTATNVTYPYTNIDIYCDTAAGTAAKVGRCKGFLLCCTTRT